MLYFFTGNSDFLVGEQIKAWKQNFVSKFGEFNLSHIKNIEELDKNFLAESLTSSSFLSEKKLVIIDFDTGIKSEIVDFLIKLLDNIPEETIVLFNSINPDKRNKLYKFLIKNASLKELNVKNDSDIQNIINKRYSGKISSNGLSAIIRYKSGNINKIISEIEKLLLKYSYIDSKEVVENIVPELEESIFQILDEILNSNINVAVSKIKVLLGEINVYSFYNNLIANLRTSIYILKLKSNGIKNEEIAEVLNLGSRTFLINKRYKTSFSKLEAMYIQLIKLDKKMKSGKLVGTKDEDFVFEIEKILISM